MACSIGMTGGVLRDKRFTAICVGVFLFITAPGVYCAAVEGVWGVAALYAVCTLLLLPQMVLFLLEELRGHVRSFLLWVAAGATLVSSFPLLVNNYAFHDDWWSVCGQTSRHRVQLGLSLSRPFFGVQNAVYQWLTRGEYRTLPLLRAVMVAAFLLFVLFVYLYLLDCTQSVPFSALACLLLGGSIIAVDLNAYASIMPYSPALALSAFSVLFWQKKQTAFKYVIVFLALFSAFCFYQIATPVVFALLAVGLLGEKKNLWKDVLRFCGVYACSAASYLTAVKCLQYIYHAYAQQERGEFITPGMVWGKLVFFMTQVLPSALQRVMLMFWGRWPIFQNSRIYFFSISPDAEYAVAAQILSALLLCDVLLLIAYVFTQKRKRLDALCALLFLFGAYWPFLLLQESGANVYNLFPMVLYIFLLVLYGLWKVVTAVQKRLSHRPSPLRQKLFILLCFLYAFALCVGSAQYAWRDWSANLNRSITSMMDQLEGWNGERLHIYGSLVQGESVGYGQMALSILLQDTFEIDSGDVTITSSSQDWFCDSILPEEYESLWTGASAEDRKLLEQCYLEDGTFINVYLQESLRPRLQALLEEADLLPRIRENVWVIDIRDVSSPFRFL